MMCFDAETLSVYAIEHAEDEYRLYFVNGRLTIEVRYRSPSMGGMKRIFSIFGELRRRARWMYEMVRVAVDRVGRLVLESIGKAGSVLLVLEK